MSTKKEENKRQSELLRRLRTKAKRRAMAEAILSDDVADDPEMVARLFEGNRRAQKWAEKKPRN